VAKYGEVLGGVAGTNAAVVLVEGDVEHPSVVRSRSASAHERRPALPLRTGGVSRCSFALLWTSRRRRGNERPIVQARPQRAVCWVCRTRRTSGWHVWPNAHEAPTMREAHVLDKFTFYGSMRNTDAASFLREPTGSSNSSCEQNRLTLDQPPSVGSCS
jgi:hypothetical protein